MRSDLLKISSVLLILTVTLASPGAVYATGISAVIVGDPKIEVGMVTNGYRVRVTVQVKNTGDTSFAFWVAVSFKDGRGNCCSAAWDVWPPQSVYLKVSCFAYWCSGETKTVTFDWNLAGSDLLNARGGPLYAAVAVWKGCYCPPNYRYNAHNMYDQLYLWSWKKIVNTVQ